MGMMNWSSGGFSAVILGLPHENNGSLFGGLRDRFSLEKYPDLPMVAFGVVGRGIRTQRSPCFPEKKDRIG
jgi:hypothetical protein